MSDHGTRGLQKAYLRPTLSIVMVHGFCSGRGKRGSLVANVRGPWQRSVRFFLIFKKYFFGFFCFFQTLFIVMREERKKRRRSNIKGNSQKYIIWICLKKKSTHSLSGAWSLLKVPKALIFFLKFYFIEKILTMEVLP